MKRSATLHLTGLMAGASLTVTACDQSWNDGNAAPRDPVPAVAYRTVDECIRSGEVTADQCRASYQAALKDNDSHAPRYGDRTTCEDLYGAGNCVPRASQGGGSFFTPLLAGFVIGRMLDGGYRGTSLYRQDDRYGGGWVTGYGGGLSRDYATGRTVIDRSAVDPPDAIRHAPPRVQTRTSVVSRGGFGGGERGGYSRGFGGGHFGG